MAQVEYKGHAPTPDPLKSMILSLHFSLIWGYHLKHQVDGDPLVVGVVQGGAVILSFSAGSL